MVWLVAIALLVAACGSSLASPSPAAQPTPSPAPSTVSDSGVGDPLAELSIAPPYTLDVLDAGEAAQIEQVKSSLATAGMAVRVGARTVKKSGTFGGLLLAMAFPGMPLNTAAVIDSVVGSAAGSGAGTMTRRTIGGQDVRLVEGPATSVAAYPREGTIVIAYGRSLSEAVEIITAVIQASE
jgi:hypothetical protein